MVVILLLVVVIILLVVIFVDNKTDQLIDQIKNLK